MYGEKISKTRTNHQITIEKKKKNQLQEQKHLWGLAA
jgi:hypothetical protein